MRHRISIGFTLLLTLVLAVSLTRSAQGQDADKKVPSPKQDRVNGLIHAVDKSTSSFIVRRNTQDMEVVYDSHTTITYRNKPSSAADIKEERRVICLGNLNAKKQLEASQIAIRDGK